MAFSPPGRLPFTAPMPKINLPPTGARDDLSFAVEPTNPWIVTQSPGDEDAETQHSGRRNLWNFRFVFLLLVMTVFANLALGLLLGTGTDAREMFLTDAGGTDPATLSGLSPAAGSTGASETTVYLPEARPALPEPPATPEAAVSPTGPATAGVLP